MNSLYAPTMILVGSLTFGCSQSPTAPSSLGSGGLAMSSLSETGAGGVPGEPGTGDQSRVVSAPKHPISIVQGTILVFRDIGTVSLQGTRGFRFEGMLRNGVYPGYLCRFRPDCVPGASIPLRGYWNGIDLPGTATLQGQTFSDVGGGTSTSGAVIELSGTVRLPPEAANAMVSVPVTVQGQFSWFEGVAQLEGQGTATLFLQWDEILMNWTVTQVHVEIGGRHRR